MSEGILLAKVARGTLLPESERVARLREALPQIRASIEGETDPIAVQATLACLLWETFVQSNWCGFYRRIEDRMLAVGPYQGGMGCLRIPFDRGVCGAAARSGQTQLVADVHAFPGHIACDDATRSELVIPVRGGGSLRGVLDLDSPHPMGYSAKEAEILEDFLNEGWLDGLRWEPKKGE
jgi:L-methionine (R)-S-oxide reductase